MRRAASLLLYFVAGLCLASGSLLAFLTPIEGTSKLGLVGDFAPWVLAPLALGAFASPGRRLSEIGIVVMTAAGFVAFPMGVMAMPSMRHEFPPEAFDYLGAQATGWNFLAFLAGLGFLVWAGGRMIEAD